MSESIEERLTEIGKAYQPTYADGDVMLEAGAELTRLKARVDALERALKPFADMASDIEAHGGTAVIHKLGSAKSITVGNLRAAATALKEA